MSALTVDVPFGWALITLGLFWLLAVPAFIGVAAAMAAGSKPRPVPPGSETVTRPRTCRPHPGSTHHSPTRRRHTRRRRPRRMAQRTRPPQPRTKPALRPTRLRTNRRKRGMEMNHDTEDTIYPCRTVDPETFFPEGTGKGMLRYLQDEAKKLCAACPVREACLQAALDNDERFGIWGGMTEDERAELRKASA